MNDRGLGLRARLHAPARLRGGAPRARPAALQPGDVHAAEPVRRARLLAPVRDLLHERPDDARPRRHPAPRRGPRAGRHRWSSPAARAPRTPSCSPPSSTCSSSATASRACRSSARCGRRCKATRASRATTSSRGSPAASTGPTSRGSTSRTTTRTARSPRSTGTRDDVPAAIKPCVIDDLDGIPLPTAADRPVRRDARTTGSPSRSCAAAPGSAGSARARSSSGRCAYRTVETIVKAALESYRNTGYDEISLLSLSTSDYPYFEELVTRMSEVFTPLGVKISLPSLRITETLKKIPALLAEGRRGGLTLAPEVARDDMREQIRKPINNQDLYDGCRRGVPARLAEGQALLHVRPARRAARRPRRHRRDGRDDRPDRQGGDRPLRRGDRQRLELRPQAAHALPVERHADARIPPLGAPLPAVEGQDPVGDGQVPRHRAEPARRHPDPRRPPRRRRRWRKPGGAGPGSTPGREHFNPKLWWADVRRPRHRRRRSTASATGRSTRSCPGTTSTSRRAASTWPRSRPAPSSSSRRWPGRSEPGHAAIRPSVPPRVAGPSTSRSHLHRATASSRLAGAHTNSRCYTLRGQ